MTRALVRSLAAAAALGLLSCTVPVAGGLDEGDANKVVVALDGRGIGAEKDPDPLLEGRYRVLVSRQDASMAAVVLSQESLPPPPTPGVLEALGEGSLVPSRASEHAKLVAGTAGELERSLRAVDGVLGARVHLAVPAKSPFEGVAAETSPSASVLIRHRGATAPLAQKDVQSLVAGAVPGLTPERVSVVLTPTVAALTPAERQLSQLGPITVTRGSVGTLRWVVGAVVMLNLTLMGLLLALWVKVRRTQAVLDDTRSATAATNAR